MPPFCLIRLLGSLDGKTKLFGNLKLFLRTRIFSIKGRPQLDTCESVKWKVGRQIRLNGSGYLSQATRDLTLFSVSLCEKTSSEGLQMISLPKCSPTRAIITYTSCTPQATFVGTKRRGEMGERNTVGGGITIICCQFTKRLYPFLSDDRRVDHR